MASLPLRARCHSKAAASGLLFLCGSCRASAVNCSRSAPGLRMDHAQVLASHNSYHVAPDPSVTPGWEYTHPPLDVQLDHGVRSFELDVWWDPTSSELKVMHVPGADEGSTCETVADCLGVASAWSAASPEHFPLSFILYLLGGVETTEKSESGCVYSDVAAILPCVESNCVGGTVGDIVSCISGNCAVEAYSIATTNPACASLVGCVGLAEDTLGPDHVVTAQDVEDVLRDCSSVVRHQVVDLTVSQQEDGLAAVRTALDSSFPRSHRVAPEDVQLDVGYVWPEVDDSRGKAMFYVQVVGIVTTDYEGYYFSHDGAMSVQNDPSEIEGVLNGTWVRTRVDEELAWDAARQQAALAAGATALTTDFLPSATPADWSTLDASAKEFWIPGGLPVRCNPVTTDRDEAACSSEMLEDPQCVAATTTATTWTTTTAQASDGAPSSTTAKASDEDVEQVVTVVIKVSGIAYELLESLAELLQDVVDALRKLIAEKAGVGLPHVKIEISQGSVIVSGTVTVPEDSTAERIRTSLSTKLQDSEVVSEISGIDNIEAATDGQLSVASLTVEIQDAEVEDSDHASPVGASLLVLSLTVARGLLM